jgi:predicted kinase
MIKLILVGGIPGSGKTLIGKRIASHIGMYIDKDTLSQDFSSELLSALGSHANDRESQVYMNNVRPIEYQSMIELAFENLVLGNSVVCSAPFIKEFGDKEWIEEMELRASVHYVQVVKVLVQVDIPTAYIRVKGRGESKDKFKLDDWETYSKALPKAPPSGFNGVLIDNSVKNDMEVLKRIDLMFKFL